VGVLTLLLLQNEIYFDIVEEIDAIIDSNNQMVSSGVYGTMKCKCHLSGTPECVLSFTDVSNLEDVAFHPCVRIARFERDRVLSFVPPDGTFEVRSRACLAWWRHVPPLSFSHSSALLCDLFLYLFWFRAPGACFACAVLS